MCSIQRIHTYTKTHTVAQTWVAVEWSNPKREKLMVYKTASDTINYVNWRCSDVDSTASAVVFPLIHLSSPSYHPFLSLPPPITVSLSSSSSLTALNPVLSQRIRQSRASVPEAGQKRSFVRAWLCVCEGAAEKRGEGGKRRAVQCEENSRLSTEWCCIKGGGSQMGRMQRSCPRFKPSWKGWIWLVGGCTPTSTADSRSWVVFFFHLTFFSPLTCLSPPSFHLFSSPTIILHPVKFGLSTVLLSCCRFIPFVYCILSCLQFNFSVNSCS